MTFKERAHSFLIATKAFCLDISPRKLNFSKKMLSPALVTRSNAVNGRDRHQRFDSSSWSSSRVLWPSVWICPLLRLAVKSSVVCGRPTSVTRSVSRTRTIKDRGVRAVGDIRAAAATRLLRKPITESGERIRVDLQLGAPVLLRPRSGRREAFRSNAVRYTRARPRPEEGTAVLWENGR
jgi:hypothetical protein